MGSILDIKCSKKTLPYSPQSWCQRLGHKCIHCNNNLSHEKCISLCKCYYFSHQLCFIQKFQTQIKDEDVQFVCTDCQQPLRMNLEASFKFEPNFEYGALLRLGFALLLVFFCIILMIMTIEEAMTTEITFLVLYLEGLLLGCAVYVLIIAVRNMLFKKLIKIKEVSSTRLQIQTSAFKDIDLDTNEQMTKDCLFESKKERV